MSANPESTPSVSTHSEIEEARKVKLARDVVDEVAHQLKWRFWSILAFIAVLGFFGGYEVIRSTAQNVTKDINHREIADALIAKAGFKEEVIGKFLGEGVKRIVFKDVPTSPISKESFYIGANPSHVSISCPPNSVLSGLDFDAWSDGTIRGIGAIKFRCSSIGP